MSESSLSASWGTATAEQPVAQAVLLAVWVNAWARGDESAEAVIDGLSELGPHLVLSGSDSEPAGLLAWFADIGIKPGSGNHSVGSRNGLHPGEPVCRPVLPVPGDIASVPGPRSFFQSALEVGEAVILDQLSLALLPQRAAEGTVWLAVSVDPSAASANVNRPETASVEMRSALLEATDAMASYDFAERRDAVDDGIRSLQRRIDALSLPPSLGNSVRETILRSALVLGICAIARADTPNQVDTRKAQQSLIVINDLATTARRCLTAAAVTG